MKAIHSAKRFLLTVILAVGPSTAYSDPSIREDPLPTIREVPLLTNEHYKDLRKDPTKKLVATWKNPITATGGEEMYFWSNGLLVVDSYKFSEEKSEYFFSWSINPDKTLISIRYSDERLSFETIKEVESFHVGKTVYSIDEKNRVVIYRIDKRIKNREEIFFCGWGFYGDPIPLSN